MRNFRLFFVGQLGSSVGTWLHQVAESWLVLQLTGSGLAVGLVVASRFVPILLLGLWAGSLADRRDRRRLLYITQTVRALSALGLGLLVISGHVTVGAVVGLAVLGGIANAVDNPVRRALIGQLVPKDLILNAVSLNSTVMAASRVAGPLLAGVLISTIGVGWCFLVNGFSYLAMLVALWSMHTGEFRSLGTSDGRGGGVRAGLAYARRTRSVAVPLVMVAIVSAFAWNWEILLAVESGTASTGDARRFTVMFAVLSAGTLVGALANAGHTDGGPSRMGPTLVWLAVAMAAVAFVTSFPLVLLPLALSGAGAALFNTSSNAVVQVAAAGGYHGRVMALFSMLFVGMKAVGGAVTGVVIEAFGTRAAILVSAGACALASTIEKFTHIPEGARHDRPQPV